MSIRWRLALWYGALAAMLIAVVCSYSFIVHRRSQLKEIDAMLVSTAEHVASELATGDSRADPRHILDASLLLGAATRVYDGGGRLLATSARSNGVPHTDPREVIASRPHTAVTADAVSTDVHHPEPVRGGFATVADTVRWRAYVLPLTGPDGYLTTLLPLSRVEASVARFGLYMVVMTLIGSGAAIFFAWLIAGRALQPVAALSAAAADIARSRKFTQRVPLGTRRDELGRLSDTFNSMLGSLEAAYDAQARFVADASHELRAPLTAIQGNLDIALDPRQQDTVARDHALTEAAVETSRMTRLVSDLLSLATADAGVALRSEPVELDGIVMHALGEARHLAAGQHIAIRQIVPCTVQGDADRLKQLVLILVDNAIRYTPSDGRIEVELQRADAVVALVVRDTGIGISDDDLPHVFDRFFRADRGRSRDPGGTGLGLAIARWIADMHGATIGVESRQGRGTTVTVRFPANGASGAAKVDPGVRSHPHPVI